MKPQRRSMRQPASIPSTTDKKNRRRVVVTGMGAITPLGLTVESFWQELKKGRSGINPITLFDAGNLSCTIAAEVKNFIADDYMPPKSARHMGRFSRVAVAATKMAIEDAGLDLEKEQRERIGVLIGNGIGGFPEVETGIHKGIKRGEMKISPYFLPIILPNMAAAQISLRFGLKGFSSTITTACAAATQAIGEAIEVIRHNKADIMIAGGTEAALSPTGIAGFCVMKALTKRNTDPHRASRPFDAKRDGFVPGEGAGILILESMEHALNRKATIYAEAAGIGISSDAYHITSPDSSGAVRAMGWALEDAGISPAEVDYINAHGTSTPLNDASETKAIKTLFGDHAYQIPISATKSMIGHLLGAAGGVEAIASIKSINEGVLHPTVNYEHFDPDCDLDYVPNVAREKKVKVALSNSFGFGGQNACLILKSV